MRTAPALLACFLLLLSASLPGCGGAAKPDEEEEMMEGGEADLSILTEGYAAFVSGDTVDVVVDLLGGCGGPYDLQLLSGALPPGVVVDDAVVNVGPGMNTHRHHFKGLLCEDGLFAFTLRVTDQGCSMPKIATRAMQWTVGVGPLRIVKAVPDLTKSADFFEPTQWPGLDALPTTAFGAAFALGLVPTGGQGPYSVVLIDDAADPDDSPALPTGVGMAAGSTLIQGSPQQYGPNGRPWRFSFQVTDALAATCICKLQWLIAP